MNKTPISNQRGLQALKDHQSLIFNVLQGTLTRDEAKKTLKEGLDEVVFELNSAIVKEGEKFLEDVANEDEKEALFRMEEQEDWVRHEEESYLNSYGGQ